ncbi:MAG: Enoyl-CoA hydratase [Bacteriovoracaceae bacterium]|nr:Enoyl-CoA hydratase [Bacteriovoracaceae bacterium]
MSLVQVSKEGRIATITIDRQKYLNALNAEVIMELRSAFIQLDDIAVAIITGAGDKAFVAGADIASMSEMNPLQARAFVELGQGLMQTIEASPFITIAAVNGFALGGGLELAISCDLIYASENAKLALPETNLGIIPGFGGTVRLSQKIGMHRAMEMILQGRTITAIEAKAIGLVLDVLPQADLLPKVKELAQKLSKKGLMSMLAARRLVRANASVEMEKAFLLERETFATLFATGEPQEGMKAFMEKREAKFPWPSV